MCLTIQRALDFMRPLWSRRGCLTCVPVLSRMVGQAQIPTVLPRLGCRDPSVLGGCGCPHPQMLIFSPLLLKQKKKMKREDKEKVKQK